MAWLIIWDQLAQNLFYGSRTQDQGIFQYLIISLYSTYDLGKNEILFVKSKARVWAQVNHNCLGPSGPQLVFRPQAPSRVVATDVRYCGKTQTLFWLHEIYSMEVCIVVFV